MSNEEHTVTVTFEDRMQIVDYCPTGPQWFKDKAAAMGRLILDKVNAFGQVYECDPDEFNHYRIRITLDRDADHAVRIEVGHCELTHDDGSDRYNQFKTFAHFFATVKVVNL